MKRRREPNKKRNTRNSPDQAELSKIVGHTESIRGFARAPQSKWDRTYTPKCPNACQDGLYMRAGKLTLCMRCSR